MRNKRILTLIFVVAFVTLLVGCLPQPTNQAPIITSDPVKTATVGVAYTYDVDATDPDEDVLTYSLVTEPTGMTIGSATGLIKWTPTAKGVYSVVVKVSDGDLDITQSFKIKVIEEEPSPIPVRKYNITATAGDNGTIDPSGYVKVVRGSDKTFTITPDTDYQIADVLVDEVSVGAVGTYTFDNVKKNHTIHATFKVVELDHIVVEPDEITLFVGETKKGIKSITAHYSDGSTAVVPVLAQLGVPPTYECESDNEEVATVTITGLVKAVAVGTATITVEYKGKADGIEVTVIELAGSFSRTYKTTTDSTDFYLAIGLASPGDGMSIGTAPTYNIFQGMTPGAFLFEDIQFGSSSEGQTYTISSVSDDPDFDDFATFLTNGTNDNIWEAYIWPMDPLYNAGGMRQQMNESDVFLGIDVGTDFPDLVIQSVSLTFDDIYTVQSGDFDWLTMDYTIDIYVGLPTP